MGPLSELPKLRGWRPLVLHDEALAFVGQELSAKRLGVGRLCVGYFV